MKEGKRILIIDDDAVLTGMLTEQLLAMEHYHSVVMANGEDGLTAAREGYFDLVLVSAELPGLGGREVCRRLRADGLMAPVVMLTTSDSDTDTIRGLNAGATDYVVKPFKLGVLLARIRAHIRQFEHSDEAVLSIGPFDFRPGAKMLLPGEAGGAGGNGLGGSRGGNGKGGNGSGHNGDKIRLTDKEAQILKFLYLHGDRVVSRDELLDEVWGYNAGVTTHTLETHVYRLRQKIETDPSHAEILVTEPGGYRLVP